MEEQEVLKKLNATLKNIVAEQEKQIQSLNKDIGTWESACKTLENNIKEKFISIAKDISFDKMDLNENSLLVLRFDSDRLFKENTIDEFNSFVQYLADGMNDLGIKNHFLVMPKENQMTTEIKEKILKDLSKI